MSNLHSAAAAQTEFDSATFRNLVGHFPSGVTIICVAEDGNRYGATASAFCSLSLDPPMVLVCLHSGIETARAIARTRRFSISILGENQPDVALHFAAKIPNKFDGLSNLGTLGGHPVISDSVAQIHCEVHEVTTGGTHSVFLSRVLSARLNSIAPLTYFRGGFGRFIHSSDEKLDRQLRRYILDRGYALEGTLNIQELATLFSTDPATTYSSLLRLSQEGIVDRDAGMNFRVALIDEQTLRKTLYARRTLTVGVVSTAINQLSSEAIDRLESAAKATWPNNDRKEADQQSLDAVHAFHRQVISLSGNTTLVDLYEALGTPALLTRTLAGVDWTELQQKMSALYMGLCQAIRDRDLNAAINAIDSYTEIATNECTKFIAAAKH